MLQRLKKKDPDPREISNAEAAKAYEEQGATFVDVREPDEWAEGHMPGALHIPLGDLVRRENEIPHGGKIVTVCRIGVRSLDAVEILRRTGRKDVKSMAGGMIEWTKNGRAVE
ncbi:MAG TPA: rhodanese-like domain-containing protein [Thermomicrobiales bacterium]|nr:rhodanese-like domain-containing protein [Thermomicrobiales bacterium]